MLYIKTAGLGKKYTLYTWRQTTTELEIRIKVDELLAGAKISVNILPTSVTIEAKDDVLFHATLQ